MEAELSKDVVSVMSNLGQRHRGLWKRTAPQLCLSFRKGGGTFVFHQSVIGWGQGGRQELTSWAWKLPSANSLENGMTVN